MIEAFIKKKGVTPCPGAGTKELAQHHLAQRDLYNSLTPQERWKAGMQKHRPKGSKGRAPNPNQTEKQKKAAEYQRRFQEKKRLQKLENPL